MSWLGFCAGLCTAYCYFGIFMALSSEMEEAVGARHPASSGEEVGFQGACAAAAHRSDRPLALLAPAPAAPRCRLPCQRGCR